VFRWVALTSSGNWLTIVCPTELYSSLTEPQGCGKGVPVDAFKDRYSIWRMVLAYAKTLGRPPGHLLWLLLLVALADLCISYLTVGVNPEAAWARTVLSEALPVSRWIPMAFLAVAVNKELLYQANVPVARKGWVFSVAMLALISGAVFLPFSLVRHLGVPGRGFIVSGVSFFIYGCFCVGVLCVLTGDRLGRSILRGVAFVGRHFGKVLAYLILVVLVYFLAALAVSGLGSAFLGPITWRPVLVGFLGAFLPSVFSPLLSTIFTKVNYFQEPDTLPMLK
jgi:hypothetical protein